MYLMLNNVQKALEGSGKHISFKRVADMSSMGFYSIMAKKFCPHSSKLTEGEKENLLNRDFLFQKTPQEVYETALLM